MARSVNLVWNYCGNIHNDSKRLNRRWPSYVDLCALVAGSTKMLGIQSDTLQDVVKFWCRSRSVKKRRPRWRISEGPKRSLGWVPFQSGRAIKINGDAVAFFGKKYRLWLSRAIPKDIRSGSFSKDASGRWFLNLNVAVDNDRLTGLSQVGIDLGLKSLATTSDGVVIENPRHLRSLAGKLAKAQRAGRKAIARKIHRKIAAKRRHFLHEVSAKIARENALIWVGNVNSVSLARTRMAKSVLDAGWGMLRSQLRYKAIRHGALFVDTDERWSTQTCSDCGRIGGPRGLKGLRVRQWECEGCGSSHDRDVNAARNILASGRSIALHQTEIASN